MKRTWDNFKELLKQVDRSYDGFVHAVMSYVKTPGNEKKKDLIEQYILLHPESNSSDVLQFMLEETGFLRVCTKIYKMMISLLQSHRIQKAVLLTLGRTAFYLSRFYSKIPSFSFFLASFLQCSYAY